MPAAALAIPPTTSGRGPVRASSRVLVSVAATMIDRLSGRNDRPVSSAVKPFVFCM